MGNARSIRYKGGGRGFACHLATVGGVLGSITRANNFSFGRKWMVSGAAVSLLVTLLAPIQFSAAEGHSHSDGVIELRNDQLLDEPQLLISGTVAVLAMDDRESSTTGYYVRLDDGGTVGIAGDLAGVTSGAEFSGTVAIPDDVSARLPERFALDIENAPDDAIDADSLAGTQVIELTTEDSVPLEVVQATVRPPLARASAPALHTVDFAVLNGAVFSDSDANTITTGLSAFWSSQTNGQISSVTRPLAVQRFTTALLASCDYFGIWDQAAARFGHVNADGYFTGNRHLVVIVDQPDSACGVGLGTVGSDIHEGGVTWANVDGNTDLHTIAHEIGHNVGLGHSDLHLCEDPSKFEGTLAEDCGDLEYFDVFDVMAMSIDGGPVVNTNSLPALNATHKALLDGYSAGGLGKPTADASMLLSPASASSGLRAIRVVDPIDSGVYYIEYRSGTGMDAGAFYRTAEAKPRGGGIGVRVLKLRPALAGSPAKASVSFLFPDNSMVMDSIGQSFTSKSGAIQITLDALSPTAATVDINFVSTPTTVRYAGTNRYTTAVEVSKQGFPDTSPPVVYLALGSDYPDALSAAPAAAVQGGPLLLTPRDSLPVQVAAELRRLDPGKVVIVGGTGAVSNTVFSQVKAIVPDTIRLAGTNRFDTARKVVDYAFPSATTAYIATGLNYPDALSASGAGGALGAPVILVDGSKSSLDAATKALITKLGVTTVRIAGGTGVVTSGIEASLRTTVPTVTRAAGGSRFQTSQLINAQAFSSPSQVFLATGYEFPDALAGAALAGLRGAPLYVVQPTCIPGNIRSDIFAFEPDTVVLVGGTGVLSARVAQLRGC